VTGKNEQPGERGAGRKAADARALVHGDVFDRLELDAQISRLSSNGLPTALPSILMTCWSPPARRRPG